jgi:hydroxymethylglutaryl-CoA reductase (NADPH)
MPVSTLAAAVLESEPLDLVPRMRAQGYASSDVDRRRQWLEAKIGCRLAHVSTYSIPSEHMRGNIENPIGAAQIPLGVAGPLLIQGMHARGCFYVPLATTEGALVRSYERGMVSLSRAGGVVARLFVDENRISPVFFFDSIGDAHDFVKHLDRTSSRSVLRPNRRHDTANCYGSDATRSAAK